MATLTAMTSEHRVQMNGRRADQKVEHPTNGAQRDLREVE